MVISCKYHRRLLTRFDGMRMLSSLGIRLMTEIIVLRLTEIDIITARNESPSSIVPEERKLGHQKEYPQSISRPFPRLA